MLVSTKYLSLFMCFVPGKALGRVNRDSEIVGQTLPLFVGAPVRVGRAHFFFKEAGDQFRDRDVFICGLAASPMRDLGIQGDRDVLQHRISVTRAK